MREKHGCGRLRTSAGALMRSVPIRRLSAVMLAALLWMDVSSVRAHRSDALPPGGSVLIGLTSFRGSSPSSDVVTVQRGVARALLHRSRVAWYSLRVSPDGRRIAALGCCATAVAGVWVFRHDGTQVHRVARLPTSPCLNPLAPGSVAWSPDGHRLAYVVYIPSDAIRGCPPGLRDATGVWITPYDHPRPRQVTFDTYVQASPPLSWSPDGRTLAVNSGNGGTAMRALDLATGVSRPLVRGAYAGIYAPVTGALAYLTSTSSATHRTRIWVAGARGHHRHVLVSTTMGLADSPLLWSPDGRSLAYLTDTGTAYRRGVRTLVVAGAIAPHPRTLVVDRAGAVDLPTWSPDGASIAYAGNAPCGCPGASMPDTGPAVFTVEVKTGMQHLLATPRQLLAGRRSPFQVTGIGWSGSAMARGMRAGH